MSRQRPGTIYLLHFDEPVANHARHYLGWASDLPARLEAHRAGRGARLMEVCRERGITWHLARTWEGTRDRERAIKARAESPRLCPECTPSPRPVARGRSAAPKPPEPAPEPARGWPGPGRPDLDADGYAALEPVIDGLIAGWRAELGLDIEVPEPREPEPELELEL